MQSWKSGVTKVKLVNRPRTNGTNVLSISYTGISVIKPEQKHPNNVIALPAPKVKPKITPKTPLTKEESQAGLYQLPNLKVGGIDQWNDAAMAAGYKCFMCSSTLQSKDSHKHEWLSATSCLCGSCSDKLAPSHKEIAAVFASANCSEATLKTKH